MLARAPHTFKSGISLCPCPPLAETNETKNRASSAGFLFVENNTFCYTQNYLKKFYDRRDKNCPVQGKKIRKTLYQNEWWFVINDVIETLTDSNDPAQYF